MGPLISSSVQVVYGLLLLVCNGILIDVVVVAICSVRFDLVYQTAAFIVVVAAARVHGSCPKLI